MRQQWENTGAGALLPLASAAVFVLHDTEPRGTESLVGVVMRNYFTYPSNHNLESKRAWIQIWVGPLFNLGHKLASW